jgi:hypothetical protein
MVFFFWLALISQYFSPLLFVKDRAACNVLRLPHEALPSLEVKRLIGRFDAVNRQKLDTLKVLKVVIVQ